MKFKETLASLLVVGSLLIPSCSDENDKDCISKWECSPWSDCVNEETSRTCVDTNECLKPTDIPITEDYCAMPEPVSCISNWECSEWSECENSERDRTCYDINDCATPTDIPNTLESCVDQNLYDDFSSETLDLNKWEVRQDVEGQPFMDEYWVDTNLQNFHMQQNTIGDRRNYLFPKRTFTTGDKITYETDLISKEGHYGQMTIVTGDQYYRLGLRGHDAGFENELGLSKVEIEFQENNLAIKRESPSGAILIDNLPLSISNGTYELYIGAYSGHNGKVHMDFDNFYISKEN